MTTSELLTYIAEHITSNRGIMSDEQLLWDTVVSLKRYGYSLGSDSYESD